MRDEWFAGLRVAPAAAAERARFDAELDQHHWLGHRMVGETMRYVATDSDGEWVALVGFASCAFACGPRDRFVGWSAETQLRRLRFVASNQRFCVLPGGRRQNAASAVMARTLRRLSSDWVIAWGHPVLLVETFVDPSRHFGTCYAASSFQLVGETSGYARRSGRYVAHGQVKDVYLKALHRRAVELLAGAFDHPLLLADPGSSLALIDFNTADLSSLLHRLDQLTDPRDRRGVRHSFAATLVLVACATLAGHKSLVAMSEWSDASSQEVLTRVGARISPSTGLRAPPSYATIRRAVMAVDPDEFDLIVNAWAAEQPDRYPRPVARHERASSSNDDDDNNNDDNDDDNDQDDTPTRGAGLLGVAVDGKTLRGAKRSDGTQVQLLAAMRHDTGMVLGQRNVENDKTNEILAFAPLLEPLTLTGMVLTADAMHTQRKAAELVVATKSGHYIFGVKKNQPSLWNGGVDALGRIDIDCPEHETLRRGHGRIDRYRVWTAPVPTGVGFPHAKRFIFVERESSTLQDVRTSIETRIYVTDLDEQQAGPEHLFRLINGHWGIESLHWVRDVTYDEDRSQARTGTLPRVLATLRNLAISMIRYATERTVNIAAATRQLARQPDAILDLLGIPNRLCK